MEEIDLNVYNKLMNKLLNKIHSKYAGNWVSISKDYSEVYAHSKDLDDLVAKLKKGKTEAGTIMRLPEQKYSAYVG